MSYDIRYSDNTVTEDRRACADILAGYGRNTKGRRIYRLIARYVRFGLDDVDTTCAPSIEGLSMMLALAGVRGYPVQAFWRRYARRETL
jgi:hypothetical protein